MEQQSNPTHLDLSLEVVTIITTEHLNLQSGRAMTIEEANGRASLFVGSVSSRLVALALVGQISRQWQQLLRRERNLSVLFPSQPKT